MFDVDNADIKSAAFCVEQFVMVNKVEPRRKDTSVKAN
jgi:hypothetical protein